MFEELARPAAEADVRELALLLLDAVASGASSPTTHSIRMAHHAIR